jgi:hypothetical protein
LLFVALCRQRKVAAVAFVRGVRLASLSHAPPATIDQEVARIAAADIASGTDWPECARSVKRGLLDQPLVNRARVCVVIPLPRLCACNMQRATFDVAPCHAHHAAQNT